MSCQILAGPASVNRPRPTAAATRSPGKSNLYLILNQPPVRHRNSVTRMFRFSQVVHLSAVHPGRQNSSTTHSWLASDQNIS
ncbi:hypothetical protein GWI33_020362 [Rhynchophorus ferrugineus]|uniref:Uncharacterized protein n=1 Tax=Rhynchophorus ferrugineus TaxID=354439 RepID=A0A834HQT1_RHYFE|nr:hypothetical protein GWI33_020362 [Rhynchophorus ferrugineus]